MKPVRAIGGVAICLALAGGPSPLFAQRVLIKMGTLVPDGSPWHDVMLQMKQEWRDISGGKVTLRIYNVAGARVRTLVNASRAAGVLHHAVWARPEIPE